MRRDLKNNIGINVLLEAQDLAHTDTKSLILDTAQFPGVAVAVAIGELTGVNASNYLTPVFQEADTIADADFTDVGSGDLEGAFTVVDATTKDSTIQNVGYKGGKRYIRVSLDYTGTAITAGIVGVYGILGRAKEAPVVAPAAITAT
ncbi:MAG: hypothetical protein KKF12_10430 [Proteobacteria bacterium]|nr:hypothetical protein [Desulfobacula sp.]MBU4131223.1 hypothetical protein [Pseudomonadota bacterium]